MRTPGPDDDESRDQRLEFHRLHAPPDNEVPGAVAFRTVLGRTEDVAVALTNVDSYSTGLRFTIAVRVRSDDAGEGLMDELYERRGHGAGTGLLIGFAYPDGRTVSTLSGPRYPNPTTRFDQPRLVAHGGGGNNTSSTMNYWLTPVPPIGDLTLVAVWSAGGIPESYTTIPAAALALAATEVVELWPWQPLNVDREPEPRPEPVLPEGSWFGTQITREASE